MPNQGVEALILQRKGGDQVGRICFPLKLVETRAMKAVPRNAGAQMSDQLEEWKLSAAGPKCALEVAGYRWEGTDRARP